LKNHMILNLKEAKMEKLTNLKKSLRIEMAVRILRETRIK
jgi:hypothetical protein